MKFKLFFSGDVVLAEGRANENLLSDKLREVTDGCNVVCCNFEAPVNHEFAPKKKIGPNNHNSDKTIDILKKMDLIC